MAQTQKMYLGGVPVIKNYFGEDPIVSAGSFPEPPLLIDVLIVGGGGGGGEEQLSFLPNQAGGGGGAGGMLTGSFSAPINTEYTITIGTGGIGGTSGRNVGSGTNSSFVGTGISAIANGGGGGGNPRRSGDQNGKNGGSGGGASRDGNTGYSNGTATIGTIPSGFSGFGNDGGDSFDCPGTAAAGGGGGGASGAGSSIQCRPVRGAGRPWVDGVEYARGGGFETIVVANRGDGGRPASTGETGAAGVVKIRYIGTPKATGGTITQSGGFTFHTFTSGGTFTYTG
jgi:hypothetical protein